MPRPQKPLCSFAALHVVTSLAISTTRFLFFNVSFYFAFSYAFCSPPGLTTRCVVGWGSVGVLRECVTEGSNTDDASQARLTSLAARFEDNVYRSAKTNEEYFHQIANKMYNLKRKKAVPGGGDLGKAGGASAAAPPQQGLPIGRPSARTDSVLPAQTPPHALENRLR